LGDVREEAIRKEAFERERGGRGVLVRGLSLLGVLLMKLGEGGVGSESTRRGGLVMVLLGWVLERRGRRSRVGGVLRLGGRLEVRRRLERLRLIRMMNRLRSPSTGSRASKLRMTLSSSCLSPRRGNDAVLLGEHLRDLLAEPSALAWEILRHLRRRRLDGGEGSERGLEVVRRGRVMNGRRSWDELVLRRVIPLLLMLRMVDLDASPSSTSARQNSWPEAKVHA
jgi:hypothetical protein